VKGEASLISLSGTSSIAGPAEMEPVPFEYRVRRDNQGRLVEFPLSLGGALWRVRVDYTVSGGIAGLVFDVPGETEGEAEPWSAEFPLPYTPFESPAPKLPGEAVRFSQGETVYFVLFEEGGNFIAESWYDPAGNLAGYFRCIFTERAGQRRLRSIRRDVVVQPENPGEEPQNVADTEDYYFESGGHVSGTAGPYGVFSALYGARGQPLEWEFAPADAGEPGRFSLQWDELGFLVRMRNANPGLSAEPKVFEYRYEYTLDQRGNWLSRRETVYAGWGGLLVPIGVKQTDRRIVYRAEE
jgi:hypothetical protein